MAPAALSLVLFCVWLGSAWAPATWAAPLKSPDSGVTPLDRFAQPTDLPAFDPEALDPAQGLQFSLGAPFFTVRSPRLAQDASPGAAFSHGAQLGLARVWRNFRVGYERLIYRVQLPEEVTYNGETGNFLGIEADQVWVFHGGRPSETLFLGYGLGVQHRLLRLRQCSSAPPISCGKATETRETLAMAGFLGEWSFRLPFSLQLGLVWEDEGKLVTLSGYVLRLTYLVPL